MKNEIPDMMNELLLRYCEGKVSEEECKQVQDWMELSDENMRIARQVFALYLATDTVNTLKQVNTEEALTKVKRRMTVVKKHVWWEWAKRTAAILFIPLFMAWLLQNLQPETLPVAQMIEVKTNPGMTTSFILPDSTVVYLNSGSSLIYPSVFTGDTRNVTLKGEGYFSVSKNREKQFIVSIPHQTQILVYGTEFNVEAYPEQKEVQATLLTGEIGFVYTSGEQQKKKVMMKPGQKVTYDAIKHGVALKQTYVESDVAWKDGKLIFRDTPFRDVLRALSKRYNVEFIVKRPEVEAYSFTGTFERQQLNRILEHFRISSNIKFRYINESTRHNPEKELIEIY